jgi:DNA-binding FrmR family transcriptional regulator
VLTGCSGWCCVPPAPLEPPEREERTMSTSSEIPTSAAPHGYITEKDKYLKRMGRIEGQARGISKMIDDEKYCIDILTQISAMKSALEVVALGLLDDHLKHCVLDAAKLDGDEAAIKIKEASDAIGRLVRS